MNLICNANRASLHTSTISLLLFLCLVGPPLSQFNPFPYVRSWSSKGHKTAKDTRSKARNRETEGKVCFMVYFKQLKGKGILNGYHGYSNLNIWDCSTRSFALLTSSNMSKSKQDQLYKLNMQRETWCRVETTSRFWNLPERKHFRCHLKNTCDFSARQSLEQRSFWMGNNNTQHPERRHFEETYRAHLV
ncbi:uncharacterized protein LOC127621552 [Xyrauchen texanus]|uniref:uncharacterized protein LOC127621552 n=1 Tax=Xyrauchen texanus TaxID=154827 RepID=UPI0022427B36|nr:uncharacterized protein LOC127621552 [Xyrauchen texanus]